ncbi:hypothetical protein PCE1_000674 [Barthelona sp. PCE]
MPPCDLNTALIAHLQKYKVPQDLLNTVSTILGVEVDSGIEEHQNVLETRWNAVDSLLEQSLGNVANNSLISSPFLGLSIMNTIGNNVFPVRALDTHGNSVISVHGVKPALWRFSISDLVRVSYNERLATDSEKFVLAIDEAKNRCILCIDTTAFYYDLSSFEQISKMQMSSSVTACTVVNEYIVFCCVNGSIVFVVDETVILSRNAPSAITSVVVLEEALALLCDNNMYLLTLENFSLDLLPLHCGEVTCIAGYNGELAFGTRNGTLVYVVDDVVYEKQCYSLCIYNILVFTNYIFTVDEVGSLKKLKKNNGEMIEKLSIHSIKPVIKKYQNKHILTYDASKKSYIIIRTE